MKFPKIELHYQILLGLLLGAIFGLIFPINQNKIVFTHLEKNKKIKSEISDIKSLRITYYNELANDTITREFGKNSQKLIIQFYNKISNLPEIKSIDFQIVTNEGTENIYSSIQKVESQSTIATSLRPLGTIFINLLSMLAIPLVLTTLIVGASSLGDIKSFGKLGLITILIYLSTSFVALTIGIVLADLIQPGKMISAEMKDFLTAVSSDVIVQVPEKTGISIIDFVISFFPKNIFESFAAGNMLQIVFFAIFFGLTLLLIPQEDSQAITKLLNSISNALIKMVETVMKIAPIGVFALISFTIADFGIDIIQTLFWYIITVILGLILHTFLTYGVLFRLFVKESFLKFLFKLKDVYAIAFTTSSSAATLPISMEVSENVLNIPRKITSFVLPLGATINMDGTGLYQGVAAIFISQFYGLDLSLMQQLTIIFMAVMASIGTAPVPGVGLIMLIGILTSVGIPVEGIGLILGVDRILDMSRTIVNVTGDIIATKIVAKISGISK